MRKQVVFLLCFFTIVTAWAQKEQSKEKFPLDEIFLKGGFSAKGVYGIQMMPDGVHYCVADFDADNNTFMVVRYSLREAKPDDTLFNSKTAQNLPSGFALDGFDISSKGKAMRLRSIRYLLLLALPGFYGHHNTSRFGSPGQSRRAELQLRAGS